MNYKTIKEALGDFNQTEVDIFISYLQQLGAEKNKDGFIKNKWFQYFKPEMAIELYKQVAKDKGLFIDGSTITLQFKGKVIISYNFQAYKNKLLTIYPEALFDIQNIYEGDVFRFKKKDGKIMYEHTFGDITKKGRQLVGCYCIIKTKRGEFIETLNDEDIQKMKNVAKTMNVWNTWEGEMWLKSVMKRACKRHFNDLVTNIEALDNENYDLTAPNVSQDIKLVIESAQNFEELQQIYDEYIMEFEDETEFLSLLTDRKIELKSHKQDENL